MRSDEAAGWGAMTAVLVILAIVAVGVVVWLFAFRPAPTAPVAPIVVEDRVPDTVVVPQPTPPPDQDVTIINPPDITIEAPAAPAPQEPRPEPPAEQPAPPANTSGGG